ncbi:glycosyltransferase family 1 protein [Trametes coccinea BRFM310]|uniref:Glycosyltransferase family 1 protein n=1 Tax=Trametes coccinea (strain BRFM310) TaxID=1353009 RepID=A0A1Y2I9C5_TRAC3|nr:glycosyltransferase family 1 protein [Trametes coccinea BRFM310]
MRASTAQKKAGHIVLLANAPWTDAKQLCIFATRVVRVHPTHVTIFTNEAFVERARREVASELAQDAARGVYIRIVALPSDRHQQFVDPVFEAAFAKVYRQIVAGQPIQCGATGEVHEALPVPEAIITPKNSTLEALARLRAQSSGGQTAVAAPKLLTWYSRVPAYLFFFHGPSERGGIGDVRAKTVSFLESTLLRVPGYEPMYSHEIQPQELNHHGNLGLEWLTIYDMFTKCDGVLVATPECYDPLSLIGTRAWMAETGRGAYAVGPIVSTGVRAVENELMEADKGTEVRDFVSKVLKSRGPKSLLYISFGASMWPKYPEKLWAFLDIVMERRIPFILSHASEFAQIPDDVREKLSWYNLGLLSSWCPQQMILNHPVTGWFLTHCGHCSVMEAISAGVPMICWPFAADGALNAVHLTDTLKCAYELLEVRTGHGLRRVYRTGVRPVGTLDALRSEARAVLEQAFGEDGERRRERVLRMRERFAKAWVPDSEERKEDEEERSVGLIKAHDEGAGIREVEKFLEGLCL